MAIIDDIRSMRGMGIFSDRTKGMPSLQLRRYNLIYGFNGSGKSTLSRMFASLETGSIHPKLPAGCFFELTLDDKTTVGVSSNLGGLKHRVKVFNHDYVEQNLQWSAGRAVPIFYIGSDQADAAAELREIEKEIQRHNTEVSQASAAVSSANQNLVRFKRDQARLTASRLHLVGRRYEAPALARDYEQWKDEAVRLRTDELQSFEDKMRADPPSSVSVNIEFPASRLETLYRSTVNLCGQSLREVVLGEAKSYPEMLVWIKQGHEFHTQNNLDHCLFCGNQISDERKSEMEIAFDVQVNKFIEALDGAGNHIQTAISRLAELGNFLPTTDVLRKDLRPAYADAKKHLANEIERVREHLDALSLVLSEKRKYPATPVDTSSLPALFDVVASLETAAKATEAVRSIIDKHNVEVGNFLQLKEEAELAIRKHFIADCKQDFSAYIDELNVATQRLNAITEKLAELEIRASELRRKVNEHGRAADAVNKIVASYLGHGELTIHPVEEGYEFRRHGRPIEGVLSEGEKTSIALAYFLSSLEAEGRKLSDLIVVLDDPISSLDSKALNYACALIRNCLNDAAQLIVLTHNLQCMNEFRKAWKNRAKPQEKDKEPTATYLFIDVKIPSGQKKRSSSLVGMPRLLREYDSEYHYLFSNILRFHESPEEYTDYGYLLPNTLRRVLEAFLAFKCPGSSGLLGKIDQITKKHPDLDTVKMAALQRLADVESHSDSIDDFLTFSSMTLEETREAAAALLEMMRIVDDNHLSALRKLCRTTNP